MRRKRRLHLLQRHLTVQFRIKGAPNQAKSLAPLFAPDFIMAKTRRFPWVGRLPKPRPLGRRWEGNRSR